jgi:hypothetical protein
MTEVVLRRKDFPTSIISGNVLFLKSKPMKMSAIRSSRRKVRLLRRYLETHL